MYPNHDDPSRDRSSRDLLGFLVLALVAGLMIAVALSLGGGVGD